MIKLLQNADVYTPKHIGLRDILICDKKILLISQSLKEYESLRGVDVYDLKGLKTMPGYIDQHLHITGGGGEQGFNSRVPEIKLSEIVSAGITTVLGMLGTDSITRSLENVFAKARQLDEDGITAFILTGSYSYPSPTITGSIVKDIAFIENVIGAKIAISDHRSSNITIEKLIDVCSQSRLGGMISNKAGVTVIHVGSGKTGLTPIYEMLDKSDIPLNNILPTHVGRSEELLRESISFAKQGGNIDITACQSGKVGQTASQVLQALNEGVKIDRITISSDGRGSQPIFNGSMQCIGFTYTMPDAIHKEIEIMISELGISVADSITVATVNVANRLGLEGKKGTIRENADADILVWDENMNIKNVFAKGELVVRDSEVVLRDRFEQ